MPPIATTTLVHVAQLVSLTASLFLSGINIGASHLTLPILHRLDTQKVSPAALVLFYHHSARLMIPFTIMSSITSAIVATQSAGGERVKWIVSSAAAFITLPLARVCVRETNKYTLAKMAGDHKSHDSADDDDQDSARSKDLLLPDLEGEEDTERQQVLRVLKRWKRMNLIRCVLALVGGMTAAVAVVYKA